MTKSPETKADDRLIVALDVPNALQALALTERLGDSVSFYKIGLGMLTGGGLALANELKQEHGKRIFLDMKLFDIGATVEAAVRGLAQYDLDFLTVHGDPHVVKAAKNGAGGKDMKILAVTILTSLDRADLDDGMMRDGSVADIVQVKDSAGRSAAVQIAVGPAITISPAGPTLPILGTQTFVAQGGKGAPYTWKISAGSGTPTINASGVYTAGRTGNSTDQITAKDSLGNQATIQVYVQ